MKITFQYDKEKDIWCLLNKGKSSNNSVLSTKAYEQLVVECGENPTHTDTSIFIDRYISAKYVSIENRIKDFQKEWEDASLEFQKRAESIFGVSLPENIIAYLTVNNRCPYNIESNYFFVSITTSSLRAIVMHELWHFYTWYGLGVNQEKILGKERYNELKEALTVILNTECKKLFPEGTQDNGYLQHQDLRKKMTELWSKEKDIHKLWQYLT